MRFDYIKVVRELDHDEAQLLGHFWYETFEGPKEETGAQHSATVKTIRKLDSGKYLWTFEAWGERCAEIDKLQWKAWAPFVQRLDVRDDIDISRDGIDNMYQHLRNHKAGSKNVTMYDSRQRAKRDGRDTGGYGIGIGSHKSDLRTTFYVRGFECGAYEFQLSGKKLRDKIQAVNLMADGPFSNPNMTLWYQVALSCWSTGWADVQKTFGMQKEDIESLSRGDEGEELTVEKQLAMIDAMLDAIPKDALMSVVESVQLRLM